MDLDAFKMICGPNVTGSLSAETQAMEPIVLKREGCCGFGPEVLNVRLTMTRTPPIPPLALDKGASSSCPVVVRFSVLFCITWGGDNPAMVGSSSGWDRQGCQGPET
ncbi:hypothetical protein CgunFtcFv8_007366 [Champsocephalus gunnari]|uniref:Uncharacterized protein n=1 Tax=Champsocephalus gunnari TaxID=52237 RepID=A0AAN8CHD4_CHAGU|nr:hypothetical protein CgunFtcFv8_007366 [Champsocephalus gunnari]